MIWKRGIYVLTADVANPRGDHRCVHKFWRRKVWKKGSRFVVRDFEVGAFEASPLVIAPLPLNTDVLVIGGKTGQPVIDLLVPHLEMEPESLESILLVQQETAAAVLRRLLKSGKLTLEDLKWTPTCSTSRKTTGRN